MNQWVSVDISFLPFLEFPDCDFELNYCDWHLDEELNGTEFFQFIRTKGSVHENSNDGPIVDHDMNKEGKLKESDYHYL